MVLQSPREFTLALRRPPWAGEDFAVEINGVPVPEGVLDPYKDVPDSGRAVAGQSRVDESGTYVELRRTWKTGDRVNLILPKTLHLRPTPDNPRVAAVMWGPLILAADLGPEQPRGRRQDDDHKPPVIPVFVAAEQPLDQWIKADPAQPGHFLIAEVGRDNLGADLDIEVTLVPFYRLHRRTYSVYFDLFTLPEWDGKKAEYVAEQKRQRQLEKATVAYAQPGEMQPERNYNYQGPEDARVRRVRGRPGRWSRSWISFDLPVEIGSPMALVVTYDSGERSRTGAKFDVLVDGKNVGSQEIIHSTPPRFFDVVYPIDAKLIKGKEIVTVRFEASEGNPIATIFGIRMIRGSTK